MSHASGPLIESFGARETNRRQRTHRRSLCRPRRPTAHLAAGRDHRPRIKRPPANKPTPDQRSSPDADSVTAKPARSRRPSPWGSGCATCWLRAFGAPDARRAPQVGADLAPQCPRSPRRPRPDLRPATGPSAPRATPRLPMTRYRAGTKLVGVALLTNWPCHSCQVEARH
jgi:hypothetical protein